jgi:hypothetical protein
LRSTSEDSRFRLIAARRCRNGPLPRNRRK